MMRIKPFIFLFVLCICFICSSCSGETTITTDSNREYSFEEIRDNIGDLYLSCGSFYSVDADALRSYSEIIYSEHAFVPADAREAAQTGASILDTEYENWSENNSIAVFFNQAANAWIISGQLTDRNSTGKTGVIAIEATTGEVLCIVCEASGT